MKEASHDIADNIQAGAKSIANKIKNPDQDISEEFEKEKLKEKIDN